MGILPLQFLADQNPETLGLTGEESYEIAGLDAALAKFAPGKIVEVKATAADGTTKTFKATLRIDTPQEVLYYQHGGILQYVIRQLVK
jgi:aconitate hydratase